jgi:uncharacterized membrane protein YvlD (DUF360 family)
VLRFLIKITINSLALFLIARELFGVDLGGQWKELAFAGFLLGVVNYLIR